MSSLIDLKTDALDALGKAKTFNNIDLIENNFEADVHELITPILVG